MNDIRLRYASLIVFAARIISIGTGVFFVLILTRNVSGEEFGVWSNIIDLLGYFTLPAFIIPFWAARFAARNNPESTKTGLVANLLISIIVFPIYLILIPIVTGASVLHISQTEIPAYALASLQVVETYVLITLEAILQVKRPQMIGYGSVTFEVTKVIISLALIPWLKLLGAVCVMIIASAIQLAFYLNFIIEELKAKIKWNYVKEWLKASFFNIFGAIGQRVASLNLIILFIFGGELARGFYAAGATIATAVVYSSALAFALYPKLLSDRRAKDAVTSLRMILMFAIPMAVGAIVMSDSYLTILKEQFKEARFVLIVLALGSLVGSMSSVLETIVYGTERLDEKAKIPIRALVRSRMFLLATLPFIYSAVILPTLFYILTSAPRQPVESALYVALIDLFAVAALLIVRYKLATKCLPFDFPWKTAAKYCLASAAMIPILLLTPQPPRIYSTIAVTLIGAVTYFAILSLIDKEAREIIRFIMKKIKAVHA